ncbi:MAG: APC family permease [Elusimicrobiota bacterium]
MIFKLRDLIFGKPKNFLDPKVFHNISLVAFFAWVGLGADGLSSSAYGPEEAFLQLGKYTHLALLLGIAVAATVFLLSASYSQIIELFPSGGGGYLVASKLLGPTSGLVSGSALVVDYVLTVAISVAASMDAIYSFLPIQYQQFKYISTLIVLTFLIILNLRGIKESVMILTPIFIVFCLTHFIFITYGIVSHGGNLKPMIVDTIVETHMGIQEIGFFSMLFIFAKAFCLGGGTFTGIEAVSNGLQILREPRVKTGKKTMFFMATSLAFCAGGILINYVLNDIHHVPGQTLNATLVHSLVDHLPGGNIFFLVTMISAGFLLIVAAQAGFLDGPRVMSNMAIDNWLPRRFKNLSDRLVIRDGILMIGIAAFGALIYTGASVRILVVMYSINVFLTFTLSQLGMFLHWAKRTDPRWSSKIWVSLTGLLLTLSILIVTITVKFKDGGWITLLCTGSLIGFCYFVRHHYFNTSKALKHLDESLVDLPVQPATSIPEKKPNEPTAILMVTGYNGMGVHSLLSILKSFPAYYKNFVFASVGVIDTDRFKGSSEIEALKESVNNDLAKYVQLANNLGFYAEGHMTMEVDATEGLEELCQQIAPQWKRHMFFAGQLVFEEQTWWNKILHNQTAFILQRKLLFKGLEVVILPIRVRLKNR